MTELPAKLRQNEVAKLLGVDKTIVRRHAAKGDITPVRDGRAVYYSRAEVVGLFELRNKR